MSSPSLQDAAASLAAALARRVDWRDADPAGLPLDHALQRRVLGTYAEDLAGLGPDETARWVLQRLAMLEARLLTVQAGQWQGGVDVPPFVAAARPAPLPEAAAPATPVVIAPVVAEEAMLPTRAVVLFDEALSTEGFYRIEKHPKGDTFCWLGPTPLASLFIPKLRGPVEVRLHVLYTFVPDVLDATRVALDGGEWTTVSVLREAGDIVLIARPPVGDRSLPVTMRLDIDAVRTDSPKRHGKNDGRELSIAIRRVEVKTVDTR